MSNATDPPRTPVWVEVETSHEHATIPLSVVATGANRAGTDVPGTPGNGLPAHETIDAIVKATWKRR